MAYVAGKWADDADDVDYVDDVDDDGDCDDYDGFDNDGCYGVVEVSSFLKLAK